MVHSETFQTLTRHKDNTFRQIKQTIAKNIGFFRTSVFPAAGEPRACACRRVSARAGIRRAKAPRAARRTANALRFIVRTETEHSGNSGRRPQTACDNGRRPEVCGTFRDRSGPKNETGSRPTHFLFGPASSGPASGRSPARDRRRDNPSNSGSVLRHSPKGTEILPKSGNCGPRTADRPAAKRHLCARRHSIRPLFPDSSRRERPGPPSRRIPCRPAKSHEVGIRKSTAGFAERRNRLSIAVRALPENRRIRNNGRSGP